MAIGGDQGGSVRIPASLCGIAGLKPTFGLIPYTGAVNSEQSIDHLGPMAKTVREVAALLEVTSNIFIWRFLNSCHGNLVIFVKIRIRFYCI